MSTGDHRDLMKTKPVSRQELERLRAAPRAVDQEQLSLVLYHRDGLRVVPLIEGESLTVGRSRPADVALREPSLSRQHACFELVDGKVWVEDLGSTNGTWIEGFQVERSEIAPGAELSLGAVMATVGPYGAVTGGAGVATHDQLLVDLDAEVQRARAYRRNLAMIMIRADRGQGKVHTSRWFPALRARLRPFQRVALYSATTAEVLLPETGAEAAEALARWLLEDHDVLRFGIGTSPDGVRSAEALLEGTHAALMRATANAPIVHAGAAETDQAAQGGPVIESVAMQKLFSTIDRVSRSAIPVLIQGETGSGKEVVAQAIHGRGPRAEKPLVPINCGAIPPQLVESTLFGHERGAFTGANQQSKGVFESAHLGTVLLDEVGELPPAAQASLLRVLETKKITRVGSATAIDVDVRVLCATHRDLDQMCDEGAFRRDLLYRLDGMSVQIPPLRERPEDIAPLVERFIEQAAAANDCARPSITDEAMELLLAYSWPGNVRELRNAIERAVVIAGEQIIGPDELPARINRPAEAQEATASTPSATLDEGLAQLQRALDEPEINLKAEVQRFETLVIEKTLDRCRWDRKRAAAALGLPLRTLSYKIQSYDIRK